MDCIFVKKEKNYNSRNIAILIGYGFLYEAKTLFEKIKKKLSHNEFRLLQAFFKSHRL